MARPSLSTEPISVVTIRMPQSELARLDEQARSLGRTRSEHLRMTLGIRVDRPAPSTPDAPPACEHRWARLPGSTILRRRCSTCKVTQTRNRLTMQWEAS